MCIRDSDKTAVDNAFLVGGDSSFPNDISVFRIATTNSGRVGINVGNANLDRALVVVGTSRFTADARFEHDIEVNGDGVIAEIRTSQTTGTFNLVDDTTFVGTLNKVVRLQLLIYSMTAQLISSLILVDHLHIVTYG